MTLPWLRIRVYSPDPEAVHVMILLLVAMAPSTGSSKRGWGAELREGGSVGTR